MSIYFKPGVDLKQMSPQIVTALLVAADCFAEQGEDLLVTSVCRQGEFKDVGFHSDGNAVDISVKKVDGEPIEETIVDFIVSQLDIRIGRAGGGQYDIVDERPGHKPSANATGPHLHIEYDPK